MSRIRTAIWFTVLCGVAFATYQGGFSNPFLYDDHHIIAQNELIQDSRHLGRVLTGEVAATGGFKGHHRPIPMVSLYLNYRAGGLDPWGYRLFNLLLHLLCAALLVAVGRRFLRAYRCGPRLRLEEREVAFATLVAAALFVLHPVNSLSILMVWKRTTLFAALFFLVGLLLFLRLRGVGGAAPRSRVGQVLHGLGILVSYALSLASKETAITFPAVLLLLEVWPREGRLPWTRGRFAGAALLHLPLWIGVGLFLTVFFPEEIAGEATVGRLPYLLTQTKIIWMYVGMIFAPHLLAAAYHVPVSASLVDPLVLAGGGALLALLVLAVVLARRYPLPGLAVLWAFITLSPTSSFVPGPLLMDEDRTYLPFLLVWLLLGAAAAWGWRGARLRRGLVATVLLAIFAGAVFTTAARNVTWADSVLAWLDAVQKYPGSTVAHQNLCVALAGKPGRERDAVVACRAVLKRNPRLSLARAALVRALGVLGAPAQARRVVEAGLKLSPREPELNRSAGHLAWANEEPARAIPYYLAALRGNPWDREAMVYLAKCYQEAGNLAEARRALRNVAGRPLKAPKLRLVLADLYRELGMYPQAVAIYRGVREELPRSAEPVLGLARTAVALRRRGAARRLLARAEMLAGKGGHLLVAIGREQLRAGAPTEAVRILEGVRRRHPRAALVLAALARARAALGQRRRACALVRRVKAAPARPAALRVIRNLETLCASSAAPASSTP